jgi:hypothetical protein
MSTELLSRMRIKKQPKRINDFSVFIKPPAKKEDVIVRTKIIDKTLEETLNRDDFIAAIKANQGTKPTDVSVKPTDVSVKPTDVSVKPTDVSVKPKTQNPKTIKRPVKLGKRLKLVDNFKMPVRQRPLKKPEGIARVIPENLVQIGTTPLVARLGNKQPNVLLKASSYYLNNREIFINFINSLFAPYKKELIDSAKNATCERDSNSKFELMGHQKIVRDYLNLYTPYRGLLLYHGLGAGKTCTSIGIAEGMKDDRKVVVMTPASLRRNYYEELKGCGDSLYRRNQYWEFVKNTLENINTLSTILNLPVDYIKKQGGAWLVNMTKPSNFKSLDDSDKSALDAQLDMMIHSKYQFISYNGLLKSHMIKLTSGPNGKINPFDNAVVIIDEAHNLVSRIVNKLGKKNSDSPSIELYNLLLSAHNARIVLLSGTPIINYPNEIAIMFNIIRGYMKNWIFKLRINSERRITNDTFKNLFKSTILGGNVMDYIDYNSSTTTLTVTRNPFGFINTTTKGEYAGVRVGERGELTDTSFAEHITRILKKESISILSTRVELYKALPDKLDDFKSKFIDDENELRNVNLFKKRILGLPSYFRSAQESLMPRFNKNTNDFEIERINMSDFQFGVYEEARVQERKLEANNAKRRKRGQDNQDEAVSTYRIFSRAFCNYVFPKPDIKRPMPGGENDVAEELLLSTADEDLLDAGVLVDNIDGRHDAADVGKLVADESYDGRIKSALQMLSEQKEKYLSPDALETYSPKFLRMLENIINPENKGLHLIYSQFRTLEGIGVFKLVLEANGFAEFKIKQIGGNWSLDIQSKDFGKPMFALYTGTESPEQKEIVRKVYNGEWESIPPSLEAQVRRISSNNLYGEVIKVFMITASGAEGINLKNTRFVHITEPYWHPVRMQQVIGRARRICSHQALPEALRTVKVFLYLMQFSKQQLESDATIELRLKDVSKLDATKPITSDEALYEIARLKEDVTDKLLYAVKEASIDCSLHSGADSDEKLQCFSFGTIKPDKFSFAGSYADAEVDAVAEQNMKIEDVNARELVLDGIKYAWNQKTGAVYEFESYKRGQTIHIANVEIDNNGAARIVFI